MPPQLSLRWIGIPKFIRRSADLITAHKANFRGYRKINVGGLSVEAVTDSTTREQGADEVTPVARGKSRSGERHRRHLTAPRIGPWARLVTSPRSRGD